MWFCKAVALAGALLMLPSLNPVAAQAASTNDPQWPIHNNSLTTQVEWYVQEKIKRKETVR